MEFYQWTWTISGKTNSCILYFINTYWIYE